MILLHQGENASERVHKIADEAAYAVFRRDPTVPLEDCLDQVAVWIAEWRKEELNSSQRALIIIDPAEGETESQREALMSMRRMAGWAGIDLHLVGGDDLRAVADKVITKNMPLPSEASDAESAGDRPKLVDDPPMTEFRPADREIPTWQEIKASTGWTESQARAQAQMLQRHHIWVNNLYQVNIEYADAGQPGAVGFAHLIVRRRDRQPIRSWSHFQQIKNELIGPECEAVELYPAESNLVDAKDHYHLWALTSPEDSFGVGFQHGREVKNRNKG